MPADTLLALSRNIQHNYTGRDKEYMLSPSTEEFVSILLLRQITLKQLRQLLL